MTARRLPLLIAVAVIAADQLTKWWAVSTLPGDPIEVIPGVLYLRHVTNAGAAFGLLPGAGSFIALGAIAASVLILMMAHRLPGRLEAVVFDDESKRSVVGDGVSGGIPGAERN